MIDSDESEKSRHSMKSLGLLVGAANALLASMIISKEKLRNQNELLVIAYYCFNESLLAFGGCFFAIRRLLISLHPEGKCTIPKFSLICAFNVGEN